RDVAAYAAEEMRAAEEVFGVADGERGDREVFVDELESSRQIVRHQKLPVRLGRNPVGAAAMRLVVSPDKTRREVAALQLRGRGGALHVAGLLRFGIDEMSGRKLELQIRRWIPRAAHRPRIDRAAVDVPSIFIRLLSVKSGERDAVRAPLSGDRDDAVRDVRGVLQVMAERRLR